MTQRSSLRDWRVRVSDVGGGEAEWEAGLVTRGSDTHLGCLECNMWVNKSFKARE